LIGVLLNFSETTLNSARTLEFINIHSFANFHYEFENLLSYRHFTAKRNNRENRPRAIGRSTKSLIVTNKRRQI
jgi:hypothetical protein